METETVAVLFTDLVGSTALMSGIGPDAAEKLRREHFALLRSAIERTGGREVKNLGDGLMVAFASTSDALGAAVQMQQGFERRNRSAEHPLLVRVGISVGEATVEDGDYFGPPVVEAARLCARAEGGEILTTDLARRFTGARGGFVFDALGELELKGLDAPLAACRVGWAPVDAIEQGAPFPARLASSVAANFVGRDVELEQLASAWKTVTTDGARRVMLLAGEPGIGKTALAANFAATAHGAGALVLYGRSDDDLGIPYQPWCELLTQLVDNAPDRLLADHVADRGGHVARLAPTLVGRVPLEIPAAGDADTERFTLFGCVIDLLEHVSQTQPVLLVLDDLQWADRPSVQLLRQVVLSDRPMHVGVLGTFRDSEVASGHPVSELLAALHREGGVDRIALHGLTDMDLLALLERIAGHEVADDGVALRDAVFAETAGNPFFVGEILRHLAETGDISQRTDGRWVSNTDLRAVGLPISVREVVGRRLGRLGPDTERALALGAVIGRDFDLVLLAAVAQIDEEALIDLCDAAVEAAILQETDVPDRYTFAHALIEHTLYDGLSPTRRARAHRAIAEQLETLYGSAPGERAGELAHHWAAAVQPTDVAKAVHYAQVAAARALDQLAPEDALRWYSQAHEMLDRVADPDPRRRVEILVGLGDAQRQCGIPAHRETLLDAAHLADEIDAVDLLVRAAIANNRGFESRVGHADEERLAVIDRALERLDDPASPARARLLAISCVERLDAVDLEERLALAEEAVATARRSGDAAALVSALTRDHSAIATPWTLDMRVAWADEACRLTDTLDDMALRFSAHCNRALNALEQADLESIRQHTTICQEVADRVPHAEHRWRAAFDRTMWATLHGDLVEAERLAEVAFAVGNEGGQADAIAIFGGQLVSIRYFQGRLPEVIPLIEQADVSSGQAVYGPILISSYALAGDIDRASALLDEAAATGFEMRADPRWMAAHLCWAEAATRVGHHETARVVRERIAPFGDQVGTTYSSVLPAVADSLGRLDHLLGRLDEADAWFAQALAIHERLESPLFVATTQSGWAALLADRAEGDDHLHARSRAEHALALATAGGYGTVEADARAVLTRVG